MTLKATKRIVLPATLATLGVWLLCGCFYVPSFNRTIEGNAVGGKVGQASTNRPVRVGRATRDDVVRLLGQPNYVSRDGFDYAYTWKVQNGTWVWPLCFQANAEVGARTLVLTFDGRGLVSRFMIHRRDGYDGDVQPFVPPGLIPPTNPAKRATTSPAASSQPDDPAFWARPTSSPSK